MVAELEARPGPRTACRYSPKLPVTATSQCLSYQQAGWAPSSQDRAIPSRW